MSDKKIKVKAIMLHWFLDAARKSVKNVSGGFPDVEIEVDYNLLLALYPLIAQHPDAAEAKACLDEMYQFVLPKGEAKQ